MDRNELLENMKKIYGCRQMNAEHCFDGCSVCDFYCTKEKRDETFKAVIAMLEGKGTNAPTNSALDHIHNVVAEREYQRGYEQAKAEYDHKLTVIKNTIKDYYYIKGCEDTKAEAIPIDWIEAEIKRLRDMDNGFAAMTAGQIEAMLNKWRKEQKG